MISLLFLNKNSILKILTILPLFAIYSEPLCTTYASFGGAGSHIGLMPTGGLDKQFIIPEIQKLDNAPETFFPLTTNLSV